MLLSSTTGVDPPRQVHPQLAHVGDELLHIFLVVIQQFVLCSNRECCSKAVS